MERAKIMLLLQLITRLEKSFYDFERAYTNSDKERFNILKSEILELNKKTHFLLDKNVS